MKAGDQSRRFLSGTLALVGASEDCRKVYAEGNFSSRTLFTCPRAPALVFEARGRYVGSRRYSDDGDDGNLVALGSA